MLFFIVRYQVAGGEPQMKLLQIDEPVAPHDLAASDGEAVNCLGEGFPAEAELSDALADFRLQHDLAARNREYYEQLRSLGYID